MQLFMRRPNLDHLPELILPQGYELQTAKPEDENDLAALLAHAFGEMEWSVAHLQERLTQAPDVKSTFIIKHGAHPVATASVRLMPEEHPESGYLHWVAGNRGHKGLGLGYWITLAVLHEFARIGCRDAVLETDDTRLPALKTYLKLGFVPENRHETHPERWQQVFSNLNMTS